METREEKQCNGVKEAGRTLLSSEEQECSSGTVSFNDRGIKASVSFEILKGTRCEDEEMIDAGEEFGRIDILPDNATNDLEATKNFKFNKIVKNSLAIRMNSVESFEPAISRDSSSLFSNGNEPIMLTSKEKKAKRSLPKGQFNGDSDISVKKSGNSSDKEFSKRQRLNENLYDKKTTSKEIADDGFARFRKLKSKVRKRNYRNRTRLPSDSGDNLSEDDIGQETSEDTFIHENEDSKERLVRCSSSDVDHSGEGEDVSNGWATTSEDDTDDDDESEAAYKISQCLQREKPKHNWFIVPEVLRRQIGNSPLFPRRFYGSLYAVERLELMYKMKEHEGSVNGINFNQTGNLLASCSYDSAVVIWNWAIGKKHTVFDSGHRSHLFQVKWLPLDVENLIVTSAHDGEVRLLDLKRGASRNLATHHGASHKVSVHSESPHVIISVGEDAQVLSIDIRDNKPIQLLIVKDGASYVPLYTVHSNPLNSNEFCVSGRCRSVKIYDRRKVPTPLNVLYPDHLINDKYIHVTSAVYNYNGTEVLASYNDEHIYLFDTAVQDPGDFAHKYQGHRNNITVKGVNFFGPKSEFVCSGSDCGNIFIWDKNTEAIVQWMRGDDYGVVNYMEPHPHIPILASSGLDRDVKIWVPSCELSPFMTKLESSLNQDDGSDGSFNNVTIMI